MLVPALAFGYASECAPTGSYAWCKTALTEALLGLQPKSMHSPSIRHVKTFSLVW